MDKLQYKTRKIAYTYIHTQQAKTDPGGPEWVTRQEQCGTEPEIRQLDNAYKKRTELQQEIFRSNKKLIIKRDAPDFSRPYKNGDKQKDTPRNMIKRFNMPGNQS